MKTLAGDVAMLKENSANQSDRMSLGGKSASKSNEEANTDITHLSDERTSKVADTEIGEAAFVIREASEKPT